MAEQKRSRRGRPRKEEQSPPPHFEIRPPWKLPGYVEACAIWYDSAQKIDARRRQRRGMLDQKNTLAAVLNEIGDPLAASNPVAALISYQNMSKRPSKLPRTILSAVWGGEAEQLAEFALAFARNTGVSMRYAVADAVTQAAMRGAFLRSDGAPIDFNSAVTAVYEAARNTSDQTSLGDTGKKLRVKPATDGAVVRRPECNMRPLSPSGELVPDNLYWRRRLQNGDVAEVP